MFKKVLVPLDGTDLAEGILPYISQLAKGLNIPISLLTVIDPDAIDFPERLTARPAEVHMEYLPVNPGAFEILPNIEKPEERHITRHHEEGGPYATQLMDEIELEAKRNLNEAIRFLEERGIEAEAGIAYGKPAEEIARAAERVDADLIAMSTHGRNALGRGVLGSVTDKIVHIAEIPVLTITPDKAKKFHGGAGITKVMVPLDGSELAETALPYVEDLARKMNLEILLIRVAKFIGYPPYADGYAYSGVTNIEEEIEKDAAAYLKRVAENIKAKGLEVEWKVLKGAPAVRLVDETQASPLDLVVLTTHGRSGFRRWLLGSVSEALIRASGDPVLIIPPERDNR